MGRADVARSDRARSPLSTSLFLPWFRRREPAQSTAWRRASAIRASRAWRVGARGAEVDVRALTRDRRLACRRRPSSLPEQATRRTQAIPARSNKVVSFTHRGRRHREPVPVSPGREFDSGPAAGFTTLTNARRGLTLPAGRPERMRSRAARLEEPSDDGHRARATGDSPHPRGARRRRRRRRPRGAGPGTTWRRCSRRCATAWSIRLRGYDARRRRVHAPRRTLRRARGLARLQPVARRVRRGVAEDDRRVERHRGRPAGRRSRRRRAQLAHRPGLRRAAVRRTRSCSRARCRPPAATRASRTCTARTSACRDDVKTRIARLEDQAPGEPHRAGHPAPGLPRHRARATRASCPARSIRSCARIRNPAARRSTSAAASAPTSRASRSRESEAHARPAVGACRALAEDVWTQEWQVGDLIVWDNRCTMHRRDAFTARDAGACIA